MGKKLKGMVSVEENEMHKIIQEDTASFSWYKEVCRVSTSTHQMYACNTQSFLRFLLCL